MGGQRCEYSVEGDWSGGAFLLVAGALAGPITVRGLDVRSTQADKAILNALRDSGALLKEEGEDIIVGPGALKGFRFDATDCPDLFPPLVALASYCAGETEIRGVNRLAHKESNRGLTLQEEFGKMGVVISLDGDGMIVHGGGVVKGAVVHSRHDHRIAMACAVAALRASGPVTIEAAEAVGKSYPDFYRDLQSLRHE
jgi:3-phosphoshikimate 1-carboxyvinyltransferase